MSTVCPVYADAGVTLEIAGVTVEDSFVISKPSASFPAFPSGFVTVTVQRPAIAVEGIVNLQVIFEADSTETVLPEIVVDVVTLDNFTEAPVLKFVP
jgi:hypothetical protein